MPHSNSNSLGLRLLAALGWIGPVGHVGWVRCDVNPDAPQRYLLVTALTAMPSCRALLWGTGLAGLDWQHVREVKNTGQGGAVAYQRK